MFILCSTLGDQAVSMPVHPWSRRYPPVGVLCAGEAGGRAVWELFTFHPVLL